MGDKAYLKTICIIILFAWISFFAPLVNQQLKTISHIVIAILLFIFFVSDKNSYKSIFNRTVMPFWICLLAIMGGLRATNAPDLAYDHFWSFIFHIPFFFFFTRIAFEERYGVLIMRSICVMGLLVCVCGIIEFATGQNFIYKSFVDNMYYVAFKTRRMMSTHIHPTPLGSYLVAIFPLTFGLFLKEKKISLKLLSVLCMVPIFSGIILTFSRGVLLGAFAGISVTIYFLLRQRRLFFITALSLIIFIIIFSSLFPNLGYRYSLQGLSEKYIYSGKIDRFIMMAQLLREHPFFGVGFAHFRVLFDKYLPHLANICGYDTKIADCMYITILAETGFIGFAGFILFICSLFRSIGVRLKLQPASEDRLLLVSFLSGTAGIMCTFLTYDALYWSAPGYLFWSYAGILSRLASPAKLKKTFE